jgi:CRISPR-associated protein Cmr6
MTTRRTELDWIESERALSANPGLWLDKFLNERNAKDKTSKTSLVKEVAEKAGNCDLLALYERFFNGRWKRSLVDYSATQREFRVRGRMAVGLGAESVLEASISLHRTYGVPYIPGSALKGLARRGAAKVDNWSPVHSRVVFGNEKNDDDATAGYLTFFDALYAPGSDPKGNGLHADVMTVHHADYYMKADVPPTDWDDPNPVSFLSATGKYLIALAGPPAWIEPTFKLLQIAFAEEGIGAKTSSGYGRLTDL